MPRRPSLAERAFPETPDFIALLRAVRGSSVTTMLGHVWRGYDALSTEVLVRLDWAEGKYEDLERGVTQLLEGNIQDELTGYEPYRVQHGPYEQETRFDARAQPPQYDIAYVWRKNPRIMFPLEAKIVRSANDLTDYAAEVTENYMTCRYAPFSSEAAMLAYLTSGDESAVFTNIGSRLRSELVPCPEHNGRSHVTSSHQRTVPDGKPYPTAIRIHHLVLRLRVDPAIEG